MAIISLLLPGRPVSGVLQSQCALGNYRASFNWQRTDGIRPIDAAGSPEKSIAEKLISRAMKYDFAETTANAKHFRKR